MKREPIDLLLAMLMPTSMFDRIEHWFTRRTKVWRFLGQFAVPLFGGLWFLIVIFLLSPVLGLPFVIWQIWKDA
jgi:hypothetical protein